MKIVKNMAEWLKQRRDLSTIGFIPTMGALHAGHLSLVDRARRENESVVVSIFVNPTQFNNAEDLKKYPRTIERDAELLQSHGVDFLLLPNEAEMYEDQYRFQVSETTESQTLCGAFRPGHFTGVLTVVMKLLNLVQADRCYMGEKDYQQLRLIQDMSRAFFIDTEIVGCPIVREKTGLAMSSRNERLSETSRVQAAKLYQVLSEIGDLEVAKGELERAGFEVEYLEDKWGRRLVAAWFEGVRLIDNIALRDESSRVHSTEAEVRPQL